MTASIQSLNGIAFPSEITMLQEAFDEVCRDYDIDPDSADGHDLARAVMSIFNAGVDEKTQIIDSLHEYLGRKSTRLTG